MCSRTTMVGVMSCVVLTGLVTLSGCESNTGESTPQTLIDASISIAVQKKLTSDRLAYFPRIDVDTERGVVNLSGVVQTEAQRAQAARLAQEVEGVIRVDNNLQIQNRPPTGEVSPASKSKGIQSGVTESSPGQVGQTDLALREQGDYLVQGEVLRVDGDHYIVRGEDGREVSFRADKNTITTEKIKSGDRIEAKVDATNHAVWLLPAP